VLSRVVIGRPATDALQSTAVAGNVSFRKLRWLFRTAKRDWTRIFPSAAISVLYSASSMFAVSTACGV
jgi:hypothetical protein